MDFAHIPYVILIGAVFIFIVYGIIDQIRFERAARESLFENFDQLARHYNDVSDTASEDVSSRRVQNRDGSLAEQRLRFDRCCDTRE